MITHILADGRKLKDITGHKITRENAPAAYEALERIRRESHDIRGFTESQSDNKND